MKMDKLKEFKDNKMIEVHTLLCHRDVESGIICLGSLLKYSRDPLGLIIHDDGSLTEEDTAKLRLALNGPKIILRKDADKIINNLLKEYPNCKKFRDTIILGLKLFDVALLGDNDVAYCDSDILFLKSFKSLFVWENEDSDALFMEDIQNAYSINPLHLSKNTILMSKINAGIFFIRRNKYRLDYLEKILSNKKIKKAFKHPVWAEQTCWAFAAYNLNARIYNPHQIRILTNNLELTDETVAIHFISAHRGALKAYKNYQCSTDQVHRITTHTAKRLSRLDLIYSIIKRKMRRVFY